MSEEWEGIVNTSPVLVPWADGGGSSTPVLVLVPSLRLNYLGTVDALGVTCGLGGFCGAVGVAK